MAAVSVKRSIEPLNNVTSHPRWRKNKMFYIRLWDKTKPLIDLFYIQLFQEHALQNVHATISVGNIGNDQYTVFWHCCWWAYFCCFPLTLANIRPWLFVPFLTSYLKNSEIKTTLNTFRDCCVDFLLTFLEISVYLEPPRTSTPFKGPSTCKQNNTSGYKPPPPTNISPPLVCI